MKSKQVNHSFYSKNRRIVRKAIPPSVSSVPPSSLPPCFLTTGGYQPIIVGERKPVPPRPAFWAPDQALMTGPSDMSRSLGGVRTTRLPLSFGGVCTPSWPVTNACPGHRPLPGARLSERCSLCVLHRTFCHDLTEDGP
jgi:hypothetical protein